MTNTHPRWQAHKSTNYNQKMTIACDDLLKTIIIDKSQRTLVLSNPAKIHLELFKDFTPQGYEEYAGIYRGTPNTTLACREVSSTSQIDENSTYNFLISSQVTSAIEWLINTSNEYIKNRSKYSSTEKLIAITNTFCWFGKIHPFLDGNGHIQRAFFASLVIEMGLELSPRFAIHPRPYDRLLAIALGIFTKAEGDDWRGEVGLAAEYLGFYLEGEFNKPRANLMSETIED